MIGVFVVPLVLIALVMAGVEHENPFYEYEPSRMAWPAVAGAGIGWAAGLVAGLEARAGISMVPAFLGMSALASLNSWWMMFVIVALSSTSGHGIAWPEVLPSVLSWVLAFAAFFGTAALVQRAGRRTC